MTQVEREGHPKTQEPRSRPVHYGRRKPQPDARSRGRARITRVTCERGGADKASPPPSKVPPPSGRDQSQGHLLAAGIGPGDHVTKQGFGARDRTVSRAHDHGGGVLGFLWRWGTGDLDLAPELGTAEPATAPGSDRPAGHLLKEEPAYRPCVRPRGLNRRAGGLRRLTVHLSVAQSRASGRGPLKPRLGWRTTWLSF